jgi:hypothetical protein
MQSIIDKLQTPQSFAQSVQELVIALQRTGDPGNLSVLRPHLELLAAIDPSPGMCRHELLSSLFKCMAVIFVVRFEVFTVVTVKNGIFWDVMPYGSCKNRCFGGT